MNDSYRPHVAGVQQVPVPQFFKLTDLRSFTVCLEAVAVQMIA